MSSHQAKRKGPCSGGSPGRPRRDDLGSAWRAPAAQRSSGRTGSGAPMKAGTGRLASQGRTTLCETTFATKVVGFRKRLLFSAHTRQDTPQWILGEAGCWPGERPPGQQSSPGANGRPSPDSYKNHPIAPLKIVAPTPATLTAAPGSLPDSSLRSNNCVTAAGATTLYAGRSRSITTPTGSSHGPMA